jgi:4'-phosphopantetheinyl transferase
MTLLAEPIASPDPRLQLWLATLDQPLSLAAVATLSQAEQQRASAFVYPAAAHQYRVSRCLLRQLLGQLCGVPAEHLQLTTGPYGKPQLEGFPWHFNVSHSAGYCLLGFSAQVAVGVDLEGLPRLCAGESPADSLDGLACHVLGSAELRAWRSLDALQRPAAFLRAWTRKEACLKAWGVGLRLEPAALEPGCSISVCATSFTVAPPARPPHLAVPLAALRLSDLRLPDNVALQAAVALGSAA